MIGTMAIATALHGFNDLGQQISFTMIYTLSKNEQKLSMGS